MDEVSPPLPTGWQADQWRASSEFGSEGFQYAAGFRVAQWSDKKGSLCTVRRRLWYRIISLAPIVTEEHDVSSTRHNAKTFRGQPKAVYD